MTGFNKPSHFMGSDIAAGAMDGEILALWSAGRDTLDIARALGLPEADIANRLPRILENQRQDQEWNFDHMHRTHPLVRGVG